MTKNNETSLQVNNSNLQANKTNSPLKGVIKKIPKKFGSIKNICTFVMLYAKRHTNIRQVKAFFYAKNTGYQTPLYGLPCLQCSCCLATTEGDSLFYIKNFKNLIHS